MDRVSVVIATRNRRDRVLATLPELLALPERPPVVLVDNASSDGTATAVRQRFPAVDVVVLARNAGATARTVGVRRATTPYVAFSDDDSWWASGALDRAAAVLDHHPRLGLLAAQVRVGPAETLDPTCAAMAASPLPRHGDLPGPAVLGFVACGAVLRRTAYLDVGGFHRLLFFAGEEELLALDLARAGWELAYVEEVVAHHHPMAGPRPGRENQQLRNALLTAWLRRSPAVAVARTVAMARAGRVERAQRVALLRALGLLPRVLLHRRPIDAGLEARLRCLEARL